MRGGRPIEPAPDGVTLQLRVQPRASSNRLSRGADGAVQVRLTAAPVDGEANEALRIFLAKIFDVAKRDVEVLKGERSRDKVVAVRGVTVSQVCERLGDA